MICIKRSVDNERLECHLMRRRYKWSSVCNECRMGKIILAARRSAQMNPIKKKEGTDLSTGKTLEGVKCTFCERPAKYDSSGYADGGPICHTCVCHISNVRKGRERPKSQIFEKWAPVRFVPERNGQQIVFRRGRSTTIIALDAGMTADEFMAEFKNVPADAELVICLEVNGDE